MLLTEIKQAGVISCLCFFGLPINRYFYSPRIKKYNNGHKKRATGR